MKERGRICLAFGVLLVVAVAGRADPVLDATDMVVEVFRAKGDLRTLAVKDKPDPWEVADSLCGRGEYDAAAAFARAAPRKDIEKLPEYVEGRRGKVSRERAAMAKTPSGSKSAAEILAEIDAVDPGGEDVYSIKLLSLRARALRELRRLEESAEAFLAAANAAERIGWWNGVNTNLYQSGLSAYRRSDWRGALASWDRNQKLLMARGRRGRAAIALGNLGALLTNLGDFPQALDYQKRALAVHRDLGDESAIAATLGNLGVVHFHFGAYGDALACFEESLELGRKINRLVSVSSALNNMGVIYQRQGDFERALTCLEQSVELERRPNREAALARSLANIGSLCLARGSFAESLRYMEQAQEFFEAVKDRSGVAGILLNLGTVHAALGDHVKALDFQQRALKISRGIGDKAETARTLSSIGNVHQKRRDFPRALECQQEALRLLEALEDRDGIAATLGNIGITYTSMGEHEKALESMKRSLRIKERLKDRPAIAKGLESIGEIHRRLGNLAEAATCEEQARALAVELGALAIEIRSLWGLALVRLDLDRPADAVEAAREGVGKLPLLVGGLAEDEAASARGRWLGLLEIGVRAGAQLEDPAQVSFFLEHGRAGALLEALGGRDRLREARIPEPLRKQEATARDAERVAMWHYRRVLDRGDDAAPAWKNVVAARDGILEAVRRIQREAKAQAALLYPEASPLSEIQGTLREGESCVFYALLSSDAVALVIERDRARIVELGESAAVRKAAEAFQHAVQRPDARGVRVAAHERLPFLARRLRRLVVEPLGLTAKTTRLLVSPDGLLAYLPFCVLVKCDVVYVPSGTIYRLLREARTEPGEKVLALGDPDYGAKRDVAGVAWPRRAMRLEPLPASGDEARSVGDEVLVGKAATIPGFRAALAKARRWRAVHFACHGLIDPERPVLSSLALTPTGESDGFLTCLDVYRMEIPADLVVLSACETAKGRVYEAEGVIGFTRAFLFAGAPRVIVSLWKVDDEATAALMRKFYELWKPASAGGTAARRGAAAALREAQLHVAAQDGWSPPYYWAAWQLWGLGE